MKQKGFYVSYQITVRLDAPDKVEAQGMLFRKLRRFAKRITADGAFSLEPQYVEEATTGHVWDVR